MVLRKRVLKKENILIFVVCSKKLILSRVFALIVKSPIEEKTFGHHGSTIEYTSLNDKRSEIENENESEDENEND